jgi:hypothetical protein
MEITNVRHSLGEPRQLTSHSIKRLQFSPKVWNTGNSTANQNAFQHALRTTDLKKENEQGTIFLKDTGTKDIRKREWHSILHEKAINALDCAADHSIPVASIRKADKRAFNPSRPPRVNNIAKGTVQKMEVTPGLLAIHLQSNCM